MIPSTLPTQKITANKTQSFLSAVMAERKA